MHSTANPFRIHGTVTGSYFANREAEVERIARALDEPGSKVLVYGPRRMGKTSAIRVAIERVEQEGGRAFLADLSTASTVADMANRILEAAARTLGKRWKDLPTEFVRRLGVSLRMEPDPGTGLILPSLDLRLRSAPVEDQRRTLGQVLDVLNQLAESRKHSLGVVLDEFQEIHRFGGEEAEWHLRGVIQNHDHMAYILAGSHEHLVRRMLGKGRAFYRLLDPLPFGPIDPVTLARWIDERMSEAGLEAQAGDRCVHLAGPRTRDIVQLARKTYDLASTRGTAGPDDVYRAFREVVEEEDELIRTLWEGLTSQSQNVLRAAAGSAQGLTTAATMERYSLRSSGTTSNAAKSLVADGLLVKTRSGYAFDSPFVRGWVVLHTLPDVGIHLDLTSPPVEP
ncbi:MAG: AAA family ATPase [Gemmatimonadota bacterium]